MEETQQIRGLGFPSLCLAGEIRDSLALGATGRLQMDHPRGLPPSTGRIAPVMKVKLVATASTA
jgi:hypothetical protein